MDLIDTIITKILFISKKIIKAKCSRFYFRSCVCARDFFIKYDSLNNRHIARIKSNSYSCLR